MRDAIRRSEGAHPTRHGYYRNVRGRKTHLHGLRTVRYSFEKRRMRLIQRLQHRRTSSADEPDGRDVHPILSRVLHDASEVMSIECQIELADRCPNSNLVLWRLSFCSDR